MVCELAVYYTHSDLGIYLKHLMLFNQAVIIWYIIPKRQKNYNPIVPPQQRSSHLISTNT